MDVSIYKKQNDKKKKNKMRAKRESEPFVTKHGAKPFVNWNMVSLWQPWISWPIEYGLAVIKNLSIKYLNEEREDAV